MDKAKAHQAAKFATALIHALLETAAYQAVKYLSPSLVARATRSVSMKERKLYSRETRANFNVTVGVPNYRERLFIKDCRKAGEPFPVARIQLREIPLAREKAKKPKKVRPKPPR